MGVTGHLGTGTEERISPRLTVVSACEVTAWPELHAVPVALGRADHNVALWGDVDAPPGPDMLAHTEAIGVPGIPVVVGDLRLARDVVDAQRTAVAACGRKLKSARCGRSVLTAAVPASCDGLESHSVARDSVGLFGRAKHETGAVGSLSFGPARPEVRIPRRHRPAVRKRPGSHREVDIRALAFKPNSNRRVDAPVAVAERVAPVLGIGDRQGRADLDRYTLPLCKLHPGRYDYQRDERGDCGPAERWHEHKIRRPIHPYTRRVGFSVIRSDKLEWKTRPTEPGEPERQMAGVTDVAGLQHTRANLWRYEPGAKGRRHRDLLQEETFVIIRGMLTMYLGEPPERHEVSQGGLIHVESGTPLQIVNEGDEELLLYAYGAPPEHGHAEFLDSAV